MGHGALRELRISLLILDAEQKWAGGWPQSRGRGIWLASSSFKRNEIEMLRNMPLRAKFKNFAKYNEKIKKNVAEPPTS